MGHSWKNISYMSQHTMQVGHNQSFIFYMSTINLESDRILDFFKKHMQESLFDYLLRYRIEQSIPYLRNPEFSITETALCCGFSDAGYYSRMFKRYTGMSPRDYRIGLFPDYDR